MTYTVKGARLAKARLACLCGAHPESAQALLKALQELQTRGPRMQEIGICGNLEYLLNHQIPFCVELKENVGLRSFLHRIWPTWRHWTGCEDYPIPASLKDKCTESAWREYVAFRSWEDGSEYNKLRHELLAHCITTLQEAIDNAKK